MEQTRELFLIKKKDMPLFSGLLTLEAADCVDDPGVMTIGVTNGELACGAVSAAYDADAGDILSLYVAQSERRKGAGSALIEGMAESAKRMGAEYLQVVCETEAVPGLGDFLPAVDFECIQTIPRFRITLEKLKGIHLPEAGAKNIYPMNRLSGTALREYNQLAGARPGQLLELDPKECDPDLSAFCLTADKHLGGFVALARRTEIELVNVYISQECTLQLPALLRFCLKNAAEAFPPETTVLMDAVTPSSEQLIRHLLKGLDMQESRVETFIRELW